jgi:hypothetical protein
MLRWSGFDAGNGATHAIFAHQPARCTCRRSTRAHPNSCVKPRVGAGSDSPRVTAPSGDVGPALGETPRLLGGIYLNLRLWAHRRRVVAGGHGRSWGPGPSPLGIGQGHQLDSVMGACSRPHHHLEGAAESRAAYDRAIRPAGNTAEAAYLIRRRDRLVGR